MPGGIEITITGVPDTVRALANYSNQLTDKVVSVALRSGAIFLKSALQNAAPINKTPTRFFPEGRLKRSFFFKISKIHKRNIDGTIGMYVRPVTKGRRGSFVNDGRYGNAKNAYYAYMVENGYEVKTASPIGRRRIGSTGLVSGRKTAPSGKLVPGTLFIKNTIDLTRDAVEQIVTRSIELGADKLARRLGL
jgi:hypothetical protein